MNQQILSRFPNKGINVFEIQKDSQTQSNYAGFFIAYVSFYAGETNQMLYKITTIPCETELCAINMIADRLANDEKLYIDLANIYARREQE